MTAAGRRSGTVLTVLAALVVAVAVPAGVHAVVRYPAVTVPLMIVTLFATLLLWRRETAVLLIIPIVLLGAGIGAGSSPALAAVAMVAAVAGVQIAVRALPLRAAHLWIGLLAALLAVSYAAPALPLAPLTDRRPDLVGLLAGLALLAACAAAPPRPDRLVRVIALAGAAGAAWTLVAGDHAGDRLQGLGLNPNYAGGVIALALVAAVGLARHTHRLVWLVPAAVCFAAVAETRSRGAFLAAAGGVVLVLVQGRSARFRVLIAVAAAVVAITLPGTLDTAEQIATSGRSSDELSFNSTVRRNAAEFAADVAASHPFRGIGYGMFPPYAANSPRLGVYIATHNDYLRLAAEAGMLALLAFLVLVWLGVKDPRSGDLAVLRAVALAYCVGLLFANPLANLIASAPFWLALGCLLAARPTGPAAVPAAAPPVPSSVPSAPSAAPAGGPPPRTGPPSRTSNGHIAPSQGGRTDD
ncbi:O-antigen ligase family protein [Actinomadura viridis]|uniref:O-antigen ligase family protein n=1 Tax=Actinomadura viridis TaxID=58110 RepID=UPI0036C0C8CC